MNEQTDSPTNVTPLALDFFLQRIERQNVAIAALSRTLETELDRREKAEQTVFVLRQALRKIYKGNSSLNDWKDLYRWAQKIAQDALEETR